MQGEHQHAGHELDQTYKPLQSSTAEHLQSDYQRHCTNKRLTSPSKDLQLRARTHRLRAMLTYLPTSDQSTVGESQESIPRPSPFGSANMPALGVDARVRPSTAKKERKAPPGQSSKIKVSPFLAYENLRHDAATSPDTWPRSPW